MSEPATEEQAMPFVKAICLLGDCLDSVLTGIGNVHGEESEKMARFMALMMLMPESEADEDISYSILEPIRKQISSAKREAGE